MKDVRTQQGARAKRSKGEKPGQSKQGRVCGEKKEMGWGQEVGKLEHRNHDGKKRLGFHLFLDKILLLISDVKKIDYSGHKPFG